MSTEPYFDEDLYKDCQWDEQRTRTFLTALENQMLTIALASKGATRSHGPSPSPRNWVDDNLFRTRTPQGHQYRDDIAERLDEDYISHLKNGGQP
jgi:hypothetical protein